MLQEIVESLSKSINVDGKEIEFIEHGISRKFEKQELLEYSLKDAVLELSNLNEVVMTDKAIEIVDNLKILLKEAVFKTHEDVLVGNLQFTLTSYRVMIVTFAIHQLNAVLKEEKEYGKSTSEDN